MVVPQGQIYMDGWGVATEGEVPDGEEVAKGNCLEDHPVAGSDKLKPAYCWVSHFQVN